MIFNVPLAEGFGTTLGAISDGNLKTEFGICVINVYSFAVRVLYRCELFRVTVFENGPIETKM